MRHIAHEIRTPLNIVSVGCDVVLAELHRLGGGGEGALAVPLHVFETVGSCQEASAIANEVGHVEPLSRPYLAPYRGPCLAPI